MNFFRKLSPFVKKYERPISSGTLVVGFIIDTLTLNRIDLVFENVVLIVYLFAAGTGILLVNLQDHKIGKYLARKNIVTFLPLVIQFAFGGLFSAFFVFYSKSGTLISSWPFLLILLGLLVGNEFLKERYNRLVFQVSVLYVTILSYLIFIVPTVLKNISTWVFVVSTLLSLAVIYGFVSLLKQYIPEKIKEAKNALAIGILGVFCAVNVLYFLNTIPPLPLGLKQIGVYHTVSRTPDGYLLTKEKGSWLRTLFFGNEYHLYRNEPVYVWSSVFAPTKINIGIVHEWQYFNRVKNEWVTLSRVPFSIYGGRDGGYRGYSYKEVVQPGDWRVNVLTNNGKIIGRMKFEVIKVDAPVAQKVIER